MDNVAITVGCDDRITDGVKRDAQVLFLLRQILLGLDAFSDILGNTEKTGDLPVFIADGGDPQIDQDMTAILVDEGPLVFVIAAELGLGGKDFKAFDLAPELLGEFGGLGFDFLFEMKENR